MKYIVCHYSEIGLKGKNRKFFEEKLVENIKRVLNFNPESIHRDSLFCFVKRISGRIIIELTEKGMENKNLIKKNLAFVFGISNFSYALNSSQDIDDIKENVFEVSKNKNFKTFKIKTKRSEKNFPLISQEINERVGEYLLKKNNKTKVDLDNPDIVFFIEIVEKYAFIFTEKIQGLGGLPVGTGGKAISLLSGGIDSPVASFQAMKRGLEIVFVHFHSYPETSQLSIDKVKEITVALSNYQGKSKLYLIPFSEAQKEIVINIPEKMRVIFYRRLMIKVAQKIAIKEKALAIVTGDSIGQVASQTIENMSAIEQGVEHLIIRPLVCMDKKDIVREAEKIGTFNISILPHDDCCSRFIPKRPETKAERQDVLEKEKKIDMEKIMEKAIKKMEIIKINK